MVEQPICNRQACRVRVPPPAQMQYDFYSSEEYKKKQSIITKENWRKGIFKFFYKREKRNCKRINCGKIFQVQLSDPKLFCSQTCSAIFNNVKRGAMPEEVKFKIASKLKGRPNPYKGVLRVPREIIVCEMPGCGNIFSNNWRKKRFCSTRCAGTRTTSPKAARGKSGIRPDISDILCFYSRWEANFARILNFLNIKWEFQPKIFKLENQRYTPDFYLPESNTYIEIKNFLSDYSKNRYDGFRKSYPDLRLVLILKEDYLKLQKRFAPLIKTWEYS